MIGAVFLHLMVVLSAGHIFSFSVGEIFKNIVFNYKLSLIRRQFNMLSFLNNILNLMSFYLTRIILQKQFIIHKNMHCSKLSTQDARNNNYLILLDNA